MGGGSRRDLPADAGRQFSAELIAKARSAGPSTLHIREQRMLRHGRNTGHAAQLAHYRQRLRPVTTPGMYTSFITGSYIEAAGDAANVELENPATLQHLGTAACASPKEVDIAVEGSRRAQQEWWSMDPAERTRRLSAWAARLADSAAAIARLDTDCVGRVRHEAIADVVKSHWALRVG